MVSGQNEAERRKGEAEILSKDLQQQNARIAQRRLQVRNHIFCSSLATRSSRHWSGGFAEHGTPSSVLTAFVLCTDLLTRMLRCVWRSRLCFFGTVACLFVGGD